MAADAPFLARFRDFVVRSLLMNCAMRRAPPSPSFKKEGGALS